jgi:limonene-1,2-epoxide hydrolase
MKLQLLIIAILSSACMITCQVETSQESTPVPDYATSEKNMTTVRAFLQAHSDEDLEAMMSMLSDTLKWSPPNQNDGTFLGKEEFGAQLAVYHQDFENITFQEGVGIGAGSNGLWGGSVFPAETANADPDVIRAYGTWVTNHSETGKEVRVKWFAITTLNDAGQITMWSEWFDVNGIAVQIAAE